MLPIAAHRLEAILAVRGKAAETDGVGLLRTLSATESHDVARLVRGAVELIGQPDVVARDVARTGEGVEVLIEIGTHQSELLLRLLHIGEGLAHLRQLPVEDHGGAQR